MTQKEEQELLENKTRVIRFAYPLFGNRFLYDVLQMLDGNDISVVKIKIMQMKGEFWARNFSYIKWMRRKLLKVNLVFLDNGKQTELECDVNGPYFFLPVGSEFVLDRWGLLKDINIPSTVMTRQEYEALLFDREFNPKNKPKVKLLKRMKRTEPDAEVLARAKSKSIQEFGYIEPGGPKMIQLGFREEYVHAGTFDISDDSDDDGNK